MQPWLEPQLTPNPASSTAGSRIHDHQLRTRPPLAFRYVSFTLSSQAAAPADGGRARWGSRWGHETVYLSWLRWFISLWLVTKHYVKVVYPVGWKFAIEQAILTSTPAVSLSVSWGPGDLWCWRIPRWPWRIRRPDTPHRRLCTSTAGRPTSMTSGCTRHGRFMSQPAINLDGGYHMVPLFTRVISHL